MRPIAIALILLSGALAPFAAETVGPPKPKVAVFPFSGSADEKLRERCAFSLRAKLDRDGHYEVIDGPRMAELAQMASAAVTFRTSAQDVRELAGVVDAAVLVWGDVNAGARKGDAVVWRVKILDLRDKDAQPRELSKSITAPTDLRFAAEEVLATLPGVAPFEHPNEQAVQHDEQAERLWAQNPNLVVNGGFDRPGAWEGTYQSDQYPVQLGDALPAPDKVLIYRMPAEEASAANNVLAMNPSKYAAENNGLACVSDPIRIQPNTRYRLSFRYKSDGPRLHVFIKGYTLTRNIKGDTVEREVYRRQVPPTGQTNGQWVTITDELNPQHIAFPVQSLRIDLYAYLYPGLVMFDDVTLKAVGGQTRSARDDAITPPATQP